MREELSITSEVFFFFSLHFYLINLHSVNKVTGKSCIAQNLDIHGLCVFLGMSMKFTRIFRERILQMGTHDDAVPIQPIYN